MAWLKMKQVCAELSVSAQTVYNLVREGKLRKIKVRLTGKVGHAARFESEDVERLKAVLTVHQGEAAPVPAVSTATAAKSVRRSKTSAIRQRPRRKALRDLIEFA